MCGVLVTVEDDRAVAVRGDRTHPLSSGYLCSKGRALAEFTNAAERLLHPQLGRADARRTTSWDIALDDLAARIGRIVDESGPDAVGAYLGVASAFDNAGRWAGEALLAALGSRSRYTSTSNDAPSKPIVGELMAGLPLFPVVDEAHATFTVLIGANPVVSHGHTLGFPDPVRRLRDLAGPGRELWVVDPRRTESAKLATRHLQARPGSDHVLLAYALRSVLADGPVDRAYVADHTAGVDRLAAAVERFTLDVAVEQTGLAAAELESFVAAIRRHGRIAVQTGTGATMAIVANLTEWLARALEIVTGSADREGGNLFNPGFAVGLDLLGPLPTPVSTRAPGPPSRPDLQSFGEFPVSAALDEMEAGNLRALFVIGGNPVTSFPEATRLTGALTRLDVLAGLDVVESDTTALASHVLPCAGPLERADLPFIDMLYPAVATQYTVAAVRPTGESRPAWWVLASLAERLGRPILPGDLTADAATDDDVLAIRFESSPRSFEAVREHEGALVLGPPRAGWVTENVLPEGRWDLAPLELVDQLASAPAPAPFTMVARRQPRHLNSQLRTIAPPGGAHDRPDIVVSRIDAQREALVEGATVAVRSAHGAVVGSAHIDDGIRPGVVSVPHGWSGALGPNVGNLTSATEDVDPLTGMIVQTALAVRIAAVDDDDTRST
jgi:anaerobic selenocysteine-containing dehydrogenase